MRWWVVTFIFVAFFAAIKGINLLGLPLYLDEGLYIFWAKLFKTSSSFAYVSMQDGKTPLYIWSIAWLSDFFNNFLFTGRIISVVAGLVSLVSWTILVSKIYDQKIGYWFAALMVIVPYGFLIERMAFVDSLLTAFGSLSILSFYFAFDYLKQKKSILKAVLFIVLSGMLLGVAYLTKTTAKAFLITQLLIGAYWLFGLIKAKEYKKVIIWTLALGIVFFVYLEIVGYLRIGAHRFWGEIAIKEKLLTFTSEDVFNRLIHIYDSNVHGIYLRHGWLLLQYLGIYFGGIIVLFIVGLWTMIKHRQKQLWVLAYALLLIVAVLLFGKVTASRYFYIAVPALVAISAVGVTKLWGSKKIFVKGLVIVIFAVAVLQDILLVFNPLSALYVHDDKSYFVTSNLSALGLEESVELIRPNTIDSIVGITGVWGVLEGSQTVFGDAGIETVNIDRWLERSDLNTQGKCAFDQKKFEGYCYKTNLGAVADSNKANKYLYLTRGSENLEILSQFYKFKVEKEFYRSQKSKVVLVKIIK